MRAPRSSIEDDEASDSAQLAAAKGGASIQLTLAGPGSGKTSTLTGRFVHLIRQGVDPAHLRRPGAGTVAPSHRRACRAAKTPAAKACIGRARSSLVSFVPHNWPRRRSEVRESGRSGRI